MTAPASDVRERAARACITSLVGSLADNKAALGRRYGEWAVSAPTLESAVAAAAMAQDELGHARSSYPVLKALGVPDPEVDAGRRLALLDDELPSWAAFVAANLVVDAMLTAFVESAVDSSIEPLAQRARKILQEEGSHRVHAEAWTRRLLGRGGPERADLLAAIDDAWAQAARWPGPDDDAGYAAALELGLVAQGPAALRERVRRAVGAVLAGEPGAAARLADPTGWAGWDAARRRAS